MLIAKNSNNSFGCCYVNDQCLGHKLYNRSCCIAYACINVSVGTRKLKFFNPLAFEALIYRAYNCYRSRVSNALSQIIQI